MNDEIIQFSLKNFLMLLAIILYKLLFIDTINRSLHYHRIDIYRLCMLYVMYVLLVISLACPYLIIYD